MHPMLSLPPHSMSISLFSMSVLIPQLCNNLEGWDGQGGGREVQEGGNMGKPMADSC